MKPRLSLERAVLGAAALASCALVAAHAHAFSLKVTPIPITGGGTSTMVELRNEGTEPLRVQASTHDWSQSPSGEDKLTPSTELLIFPSMLTVQPGETRKLRVGTQGGYGASEKSFRVLFSEIPPNSSPVDGEKEVVAVIAHVSIPIFVRPPGAVGVPRVQGLAATKDRVRFAIQNVGAAHALVERIRLEFTGEAGRPIGSTEIAGWYVLPGQTRPYDIEIGKGVSCAGAKTLVVTASSRESGSATATLEQPACAN